MKWQLSILGALLLGGCAQPTKVTEDGWTLLFNEESFEGWTFDVYDNASPASIFSIEDGTIVVDGKDKANAVIQTKRVYGNYELSFEWRWPDVPGNSGVLIHSTDARFMDVWPKSIEVQLGHGNAGDLIFIGETFDVMESQIPKNLPPDSWKHRLRTNLTDDSEKAPGEWNHALIVAEHNTITVYINGELVNRCWEASTEAGRISFQAEKANVEFRNIRIRDISTLRR